MKKIITILFCFASLNLAAQLNSGIGFGYDFNGRAIAQLQFNYELHRFSFGAEIRPSLSRSVYSKNYEGFKAGVNLFNEGDAYFTSYSIIPEIGYFYNKQSSDKVILNKWYFGYGIKAYKMINEQGAIYLEPIYINQSIQVTAGMILKFN